MSMLLTISIFRQIDGFVILSLPAMTFIQPISPSAHQPISAAHSEQALGGLMLRSGEWALASFLAHLLHRRSASASRGLSI